MSLPCVLFLLLWVTASSSLEHNNVVVNGKHQADTLSQEQLHKQVRLSKIQVDRGRETQTEEETHILISKNSMCWIHVLPVVHTTHGKFETSEQEDWLHLQQKSFLFIRRQCNFVICHSLKMNWVVEWSWSWRRADRVFVQNSHYI